MIWKTTAVEEYCFFRTFVKIEEKWAGTPPPPPQLPAKYPQLPVLLNGRIETLMRCMPTIQPSRSYSPATPPYSALMLVHGNLGNIPSIIPHGIKPLPPSTKLISHPVPCQSGVGTPSQTPCAQTF